jgi:hypothetical protein
MELTLSSPSLLFPAISLLLLAYTNRFLAIASLVRNLHDRYLKGSDERAVILSQLASLRLRLQLVRIMQLIGIISILCCVLCMLLLFFNLQLAAQTTFAIALILMMLSLACSIWEINISTKALNILLSGIETHKTSGR